MCNFPSWALVNLNPVLSSLLSYTSFGLMLMYLILTKINVYFNTWMILFGLIYFGIGSLTNQIYLPTTALYLILIIKYFIIVIAGYAVVKDTTKNELFFFLFIGASTVFLQMFVFYNRVEDYGRYSGFYLNPNSLGFICTMGYALTFGLHKKWRTFGQIAFTLIGFLTFSRTFLLVWLLMNLLSVRLSFKNIRVLAIGVALFLGIITFNSFLPKSNPRLEAMSKILEGTSQNTGALKEDSREKTWSIFYPALLAKPLLGNGYGSFIDKGTGGRIGVHNTYLRIMGEAGILTLILFLIFNAILLKKSWMTFSSHPHLFLMMSALCLFLLTNHDFFEFGFLLFFIMWIQYHTMKKSSQSDLKENKGVIDNSSTFYNQAFIGKTKN